MRTSKAAKPIWIKPRLKLRGTQLAGWTPKPTAKPLYGKILYQEDVEVMMPDGVILLADIFRPDTPEPLPALVSWATYLKDNERMGGGPLIDESGAPVYLAERGYVWVRVQPRGTGRSGGVAEPNFFSQTEIRDCHDSIEWVARQPWCNGIIGMTGMSYFSVSQLTVAGTRPPHLKAIFPYKGFTDHYRHGSFRGGAAYTGVLELMAALEKIQLPRIPSLIRHALSYILNGDRFMTEMSDAAANQVKFRKIIDKITPPESSCRSYVAKLFDRTYDSDEWRKGLPTDTMENINIPICLGTDYGAVDFHIYGTFELWHRLKHNSQKWLFLGPPEYIFPWSNYQEETIAWYDWQLKGLDTGYADLPPVRYYLTGAERWQSAQDWPLPDAEIVHFYLDQAHDDAKQVQLLTPAKSEQTSALSFLAIPSNSYYIKEIERFEAQVLSYMTAPFAEDTEIVGPVHLHLTITSTTIDTYFMARLSAVSSDGKRRKLGFGWLLASRREVDIERSNPTEIVHNHSIEAVKPLVPLQPTQLHFSLTPMGHLFAKGDRLLLEVGSRPELLCSEKGEGFNMFLWDPVPYRSRNTILHGGINASSLEVQVRKRGH